MKQAELMHHHTLGSWGPGQYLKLRRQQPTQWSLRYLLVQVQQTDDPVGAVD